MSGDERRGRWIDGGTRGAKVVRVLFYVIVIWFSISFVLAIAARLA